MANAGEPGAGGATIDPARLRALREARAWSQEQLADIAGLNVRTVQRAESGHPASPETRMALASAFGVEPAGLAAMPAVPDVGAAAGDGPAVAPVTTVPATSDPVARDPGPEAPATSPTPRRNDDTPWYHRHYVALGWVLVALLVMAFGYRFGSDLAGKHNREECRAQGRQDCR